MSGFIVQQWIIYTVVGFIFIQFAAIVYFLIDKLVIQKSDKILLIHKDGRYSIYSANLKNRKKVIIQNKAYLLVENSCLISDKGKVLYCFSENKPAPLKMEYDKTTWLDSESIMGILNNDAIQKIVTPQSKMKDLLMTIIAFASFIGCIASIFCLLVLMGVIKIKTHTGT